jgi:pyruvate/2-oxoglutarate dehydrogenase complex dihydrolipoamide acyltransferase (E2) component
VGIVSSCLFSPFTHMLAYFPSHRNVAPKSPMASFDPLCPSHPTFESSRSSSGRVASSSVRHLARQLGVDLASLAHGSGKGGRIERVDVEAYVAGGSADGQINKKAQEGDLIIELGRTRYGIWKATTKVFFLSKCVAML